MFPKVPLDAEFPPTFVADIRRVIRQMCDGDGRRAHVRVIRVPHGDLAPAIDRVVQRMHVPFAPTLCGYPVEFTDPEKFGGSGMEVQVMCVQDDNTLLAVDQTGKAHDGHLVLAPTLKD